MAELLKGAAVAAALCEELTERVKALGEKGVTPRLAIVRLGEEPGDLAYERGAVKRCGAIGIEVEHVVLPREASQEELLARIDRVNQDNNVHGCLILRPLPKQIDEIAVCGRLAPEKDVDSVTQGSMSYVYSGKGAGFKPCTAQAVLEILDHYQVPLTGARVAVIGRSLVIGKPLSLMLQERNATVTMCHTRTKDMAALCREQDIIVAAAGHIGTVDGSFVRAGQVVIDVGTNMGPDGKLTGDVVFSAVEQVVAAITPVPGGVGAVTTTVLASHVVEAAEKAAK